MTETHAPPDLCPLDALIARLEAATDGDKSLDSAIHAEMRRDNWTPEEWARTVAELCNPSIVSVPRYTASLDAALTLVPEGYLWRMHPPAPTDLGKWVAEVFTQPMWGSCRDGAHRTTPAIALCIAALRARATTR